jgi:ribosomal protein S6
MTETKRFKKVYYIVQTAPVLKTCGHTFSPQKAEALAQFVGQLTGQKGKIVEFTRNELRKLNYNPVSR